jgi:Mg2+-importing ATPase
VAEPIEPSGSPEIESLRASLLRASSQPLEALFHELGSRPEGLGARQAQKGRKEFGLNVLAREQRLPWWMHLWHCFRDPFNMLLSALALVSVLTDSAGSAGTIVAMVALSTTLRFVQETRAQKASHALRAWVAHHVLVRRPDASHPVRLPSSRLVPGDVILLSAGDLVPADCRLIESDDLCVAQAALTGESMPVDKQAVSRPVPSSTTTSVRPHEPEDPMRSTHLLFTGTHVVSGTATALVLATGERTSFGVMARHAIEAPQAPSAFQANVRQVGGLLLRVVLMMVPAVFALNYLSKGDVLQAALFALAVGVSLTPEMLPMVVTSTLARGAMVLARCKVIVKHLEAIHDLGAMQVLCTDKTGTLTEDRLVLMHWIDPEGSDSPEVLKLAWLNSHFQSGLRNPMDGAVEAAGQRWSESDQGRLQYQWVKLDEAPFDFTRRRMSVLFSRAESCDPTVVLGAASQPNPQPMTRVTLITKGAVDELLSVCSGIRRGSQVLALDESERNKAMRTLEPFESAGLRVIAVASREMPKGSTICHAGDENDLVLEGFLVFQDPPKNTSAQALKALRAHGIEIKVLTGDNPRVTDHVCTQVGLPAGRTCTGAEIDRMDEAMLMKAVAQHQVFAQLTPLHKERIVKALRARGQVVGFLGDGINDAAALNAADVGISVHAAVDIAREAADIVLLEKSLLILEKGVVEGRRTVANLHKYLRIATSSNLGNALSVLVASLLLPFLPMLPVHLLLQNLIYDLSQVAMPFDAVDEEELSEPRRWHPPDLWRFMLWFGPLSSIFDLLTFAALWFVFGANNVAAQGVFQSGWFVVGLITQTLVVHSLRTAHIPMLQSAASPLLLLSAAGVVALAVWLPTGALAAGLQFQPLPLVFGGFVAAMALSYLLAAQWLKTVFIRRHGWS